MEEANQDLGSGYAPPSLVTLTPFSPIAAPSSRRLTSVFTPSRAIHSGRKLAWVSLQGRLVNAEEASSAKAIGGGLSRDECVAWELFSPIQRFLIVAVIGVAVAESKKNRLISQLKKSVELRDQVLSSMQHKLDSLCEQVNTTKRRPAISSISSNKQNVDSLSSDVFGFEKIKFVDCGCWHCDHHRSLFADSMHGNSVVKFSRGDEVLQYKTPLVNDVEHEERRLSDLSDWASSVTSTADIQTSMFALDPDFYNVKKECEEKDATINELTAILQSTNMATSKRNAELEDIIRRKNSMIAKLKKDMLVLEQKLVHLTRLRRPSSNPLIPESCQLPFMMENIVYDMDSTTSPSSSDSDSSPVNRSQTQVAKNHVVPPRHDAKCSPSDSDASNSHNQIMETPRYSGHIAPRMNRKSSPLRSSTERQLESRPASPLTGISSSQKSGRLPSSISKPSSASGEIMKLRRRAQTSSKDEAPKKRWV